MYVRTRLQSALTASTFHVTSYFLLLSGFLILPLYINKIPTVSSLPQHSTFRFPSLSLSKIFPRNKRKIRNWYSMAPSFSILKNMSALLSNALFRYFKIIKNSFFFLYFNRVFRIVCIVIEKLIVYFNFILFFPVIIKKRYIGSHLLRFKISTL